MTAGFLARNIWYDGAIEFGLRNRLPTTRGPGYGSVSARNCIAMASLSSPFVCW